MASRANTTSAPQNLAHFSGMSQLLIRLTKSPPGYKKYIHQILQCFIQCNNKGSRLQGFKGEVHVTLEIPSQIKTMYSCIMEKYSNTSLHVLKLLCQQSSKIFAKIQLVTRKCGGPPFQNENSMCSSKCSLFFIQQNKLLKGSFMC